MARYSPLMRPAGMPTIMPTAVVQTAASGMLKNTGMPSSLLSQADANAPKPKKAAWPSEICPVKPTRMLRPSAAIPR